MKIVFISGDHLRHKYVADSLTNIGAEISWIIEKRENKLPKIPKKLNNNLKRLFKHHFQKRLSAEKNYFKNAGEISNHKMKTIIKIKKNDLNKKKLDNILKRIKPDILISYGCHKLDDKLLKNSKICWNLHGGLSPWYRGAITHFWPTYMLEPQFTGMTLHETTQQIDGGNIVHQTGLKIKKNDGIHDNACKALLVFCKEFPGLLRKNILKINKLKAIKPVTTGRIWTTKMWHPALLEFVYNKHKDRINNYCIKNKIITRKPILKSIFKK